MAVLLSIVCLAGCRGAPVQEMSDARQAIEAARVAGAAVHSPADLAAAQAAIAHAEEHLRAQQYTRARIAALEAKRHAAVALANSERAAVPQAAPP
ncbi:MAG TPA: DUF4398 domain-containing protein [Steroidobacteraceae bacterium]|nr:DUF4398 domain-containing protein [Steroidobacteraceae bacterium]